VKPYSKWGTSCDIVMGFIVPTSLSSYSLQTLVPVDSPIIAQGDGCVNNQIQYNCNLFPGTFCIGAQLICYYCPANQYCPGLPGDYAYNCPKGQISAVGSTSCHYPGEIF
jgi:hypothetical protein